MYICVLKVNDNMWNTCIHSLVPRLSSVCGELLLVFYLWNITCTEESLRTRLSAPTYTCICMYMYHCSLQDGQSHLTVKINQWTEVSTLMQLHSTEVEVRFRVCILCACACGHALRTRGMSEYALGMWNMFPSMLSHQRNPHACYSTTLILLVYISIVLLLSSYYRC